MALQVKDPWKFNTVCPEAETQQQQQKKATHNQTALIIEGQFCSFQYPHQEQCKDWNPFFPSPHLKIGFDLNEFSEVCMESSFME